MFQLKLLVEDNNRKQTSFFNQKLIQFLKNNNLFYI